MIMAAVKTVGLIGVGLMGHGIGKNIVEKGYALKVVAHRSRDRVDDLIKRGATEVASAKELAALCDLVIICVTASPQVEEAVLGDKGLLAGAKPGLIIADCSTSIPDSTKRIAEICSSKGVTFIDTPMTRTPKEAAAGKLGLMVGGPADVIAQVKPVLDCFADLIVPSGPVGTAHQLKLLNNFLSLGHAAIAAEAITVAKKAGIDMNALNTIVMGGGAASVMFGRLINVPLHDDDTHAMFAIRNARKDMRYYTNMTENLPVTSFMGEAVHQTLVMADNQGYGERYVPRLIDMLSKLNNC
jgi:3-hydroxyisobutyrate dehydrogenase-like beta-hydroxyacid dehydrogenase